MGMLCPDYSLLVPLKRSAAYGAIRRRVADLRPVDGWQDGGQHYFVFRLRPHDSTNGVPPGSAATASGEAYESRRAHEEVETLAVFVMVAGGLAPISAVTITAGVSDEEAQVVDLLQPAQAHRLALG